MYDIYTKITNSYEDNKYFLTLSRCSTLFLPFPLMKTKSLIFTALAIAAAIAAVSCECSSKKTQGPTTEEIQTQKQALSDSVLARIDTLAEKYADERLNSFRIKSFELTEEEKMVKPDYLLAPSEAKDCITKLQKINALAIYSMEYSIRKLYDMPTDETSNAIAKLAAEINFPVDADYLCKELPISEKIKKIYASFKERGEIAYFWQYHNAILVETGYLVAQNPELFFCRITEEQWQSKNSSIRTLKKAVEELAPYDPEMAQLLEWRKRNSVYKPGEQTEAINSSLQSAKEFRIANKNRFLAKRNALLL